MREEIAEGDFAQTLNMVDVWSGWTRTCSNQNKEASKWVREAIEKVKEDFLLIYEELILIRC
ncbi:hypothetical protein [Thermospira aquatica]|uniref:Uncharacterized protein n=1 Tax=Thermospira aquatica TaxID=2828656 RepID=A0AAX3BAX4_9SPIR|nr:hypothetical protein [Thermospira aquatica]URA09426.1 hypothetical protein KDW03_07985 [Thermospira aquatica]